MDDPLPAVVHLAHYCTIDVDSLDPRFGNALLDLGITPNDQTSNQVLIVQALLDPSNLPLVKDVVEDFKQQAGTSATSAPDVLPILDRLSVLLSKRNESIIKGRFLLQTSPRNAHNEPKIIEHARNYAKEFDRAGLGRDRFAIKLPATGAGMGAAKVLESEGVRTLGTSLFSVPQALASSQAGCLFISPYFNSIPSHGDPSVWPNPPSPAHDHPMSPRMAQIYVAYQQLEATTGRKQPLIKGASLISGKESLALGVEMGVTQQLTLLGNVFNQLFEMKVSSERQLSPQEAELEQQQRLAHPFARKLPAEFLPLLEKDPLSADGLPFKVDPSVDWLANGGKALDDYINSDIETARRLQESLDLFIKAEDVAKEVVEKVWRDESLEGLVFGGL